MCWRAARQVWVIMGKYDGLADRLSSHHGARITRSFAELNTLVLGLRVERAGTSSRSFRRQCEGT